MPHGGDIELELINDDKNTHCALLPSNGDRKFIWLVNHSKGRATLNLDGPGYYWYGSPHRQRRRPGPDRGDRRAGRRSAGGSPRPPTPAAPVDDRRTARSTMTVEYVDAGQAVDQAT